MITGISDRMAIISSASRSPVMSGMVKSAMTRSKSWGVFAKGLKGLCTVAVCAHAIPDSLKHTPDHAHNLHLVVHQQAVAFLAAPQVFFHLLAVADVPGHHLETVGAAVAGDELDVLAQPEGLAAAGEDGALVVRYWESSPCAGAGRKPRQPRGNRAEPPGGNAYPGVSPWETPVP